MKEPLDLPLDSIYPSPENPRGRFDPRSLLDVERLRPLTDSIARYGVLNPILVVRRGGDTNQFDIVAGERRWRASRLAGKATIPSIIFRGDERDLHEVRLAENQDREQLSPLDEARAYADLKENLHYSIPAISAAINRSADYVRGRLALLTLPEEVQRMVSRGELALGAAWELLRLDEELVQVQVAREIVEQGLTVERVAEQVVTLLREKRLRGLAQGRRARRALRVEAIAARETVVTPESFDPLRHRRAWDLAFPECGRCPLKGSFLRMDGRVEEVCIQPVCHAALLRRSREEQRQSQWQQQRRRDEALAVLLETDEATLPHMQYVLWTLLDLMGPDADGWREEVGWERFSDRHSLRQQEWVHLNRWTQEELLANMIRLCIWFLARCNPVDLPDGLKGSLEAEFGVDLRVLEEVVS